MERSSSSGVRRRLRNKGRAVALLALTVGALSAAPAIASAADPCPTRVDASTFTSEAALKSLNEIEASYGQRPTASTSQTQFIDWLEGQMQAIPGITTSSLNYDVDRWDAQPATLQVGGTDVQLSGPVPYTATTGSGGVTAPLVYLPASTAITAANSAGKIVVRDLPTVSVPNLVFYPIMFGFSMYDPALSVGMLGSTQNEGIAQSAVDLQAANAAGAKGVLSISQLPHDQFKNSYAPYEGLPIGLPGAYLAADAGKQVKDAITANPNVQAKLTQESASTPKSTRTLLATLPGGSAKKVVVESHTDGMSAIWDNGPVAMIAMARYFAGLPVACRPETIQFAFVTGHLKQRLIDDGERDGGAGQLAKLLDAEYDQGKVKGVVVLEHFGAKQYAPVARPGGLPGVQLQQNGKRDLLLVPVSESLDLRNLVKNEVESHDLRPTAVLKGLDAPDLGKVPHQCSFGGEGTPYNHHLLPTVAAIAAPRTLFSPNFGVEGIDFDLMRRQTLAFTEVVRGMSQMTQAQVAGDVTFMRTQRASGTPGCA